MSSSLLQPPHFFSFDQPMSYNILREIMSLGRCSLLELQAGIERWESKVVRYEKLRGKLDDEIKRAGLPEELEKHQTLNSTRSKTFEDVCSQVVKSGLRIRGF